MIRLWHGALAVLVSFALVGQIALTVGRDRSLINLFSFFTIESNLLILIVSVLLVIRPDRNEPWFAIPRLAGLTGITVTGIVYATVLAGGADFSGIEWLYDKIFHYAVPVAAILGFVLFRPRTRFARSDMVWIVWPLWWLGYTLIRAGVSTPDFVIADGQHSYVPYGFLDIQRHGAGYVILSAIIVTVLLVGISWLYTKFSGRTDLIT